MAWLLFLWATRLPKAGGQGLFQLRREELAARHGLATSEIQLYDVA